MDGMTNRERVAAGEIRRNLRVYLDRVKAGEVLEVTQRGELVALLMPVPERQSVIQRLVAEGRATAPTLPRATMGPPLRLKLERPMSEILDELKEDRF
jgi:prevent-host-death family protein